MNGTATVNQDMAAVMEEIRHLAATRKHRLTRDMLGTRPLTPVQAGLVLAKLRSCPPIEEEAAQPVVSRETPRQDQAAPVPPPLRAFKDTPVGYFATPSRSGDIDFWLTEPGKGKWEGLMFLRRVLGGAPSDQRKLRSVRLDNMQQRLGFQAIHEYGLDASQELFADKLERCMDCSSPLTDPDSRAARRGPKCRNKRR